MWRGKNFVYGTVLHNEKERTTATQPCCFAGPGEYQVGIMGAEAFVLLLSLLDCGQFFLDTYHLPLLYQNRR